jgi:acetyl esterase
MALDQATQALITAMAAAGRPPLHESTVDDARRLGRESRIATRAAFGPGPDVLSSEDLTVDAAEFGGSEGSFPVRVLKPFGQVRGVIVYYHGGGWVLGEVDGFDPLGRSLATATSCAVVLVDYRMAPEHRYPTAVLDAWAAYRWAAANVSTLAGAEVPLIVAGDSAGGNLAAVVAQRTRDESGPDLALQVLIYPVTDADLTTDSYLDPQNKLMLTREGMIWFWDHYAPDPASRRNIDASPSQAADLSGLAPTVLITAEHDVLRDEGEAYAARLSESGVDVRFRRFDGQMHGFFPMVGILPGSAAAIEFVSEAISTTLATHTAALANARTDT